MGLCQIALHTLRMIGFKPKRCSSSHQSSTLAVGYFSLSLITLIESLFRSLLLMLVGRGVMRSWGLRALLKPLQILPAPLLFVAYLPATPTLDPLPYLPGVPHPSIWRGLLEHLLEFLLLVSTKQRPLFSTRVLVTAVTQSLRTSVVVTPCERLDPSPGVSGCLHNFGCAFAQADEPEDLVVAIAMLIAMLGAAAAVRDVRRVRAPHPGFAQAFGVAWEQAIAPEQQNGMMQRRWSWHLPAAPEPQWQRDVPFWTLPDADRRSLCDPWQPPPGVAPSGLALVYLHGSACYLLDKDFFTRAFFRHLAAQGHVVMDVAYRLYPETDMLGMLGYSLLRCEVSQPHHEPL
jgi:hypothetical protein